MHTSRFPACVKREPLEVISPPAFCARTSLPLEDSGQHVTYLTCCSTDGLQALRSADHRAFLLVGEGKPFCIRGTQELRQCAHAISAGFAAKVRPWQCVALLCMRANTDQIRVEGSLVSLLKTSLCLWLLRTPLDQASFMHWILNSTSFLLTCRLILDLMHTATVRRQLTVSPRSSREHIAAREERKSAARTGGHKWVQMHRL